MDQKLLVIFVKRFLKFFKRESKEVFLSLEMRRPQNLDEREQLKKLRLM